jgi:hypothetical protein
VAESGSSSNGLGGSDAAAGAGGSEVPVSREEIPPPQPFCAAFKLEFASDGPADCGRTRCPDLGCGCVPQGAFCSPVLGCVQATDCSAACADYSRFLGCTLFACREDADCANYPFACVRSPSEDGGLCASMAGEACADDSDCRGGGFHCVALNHKGGRQCQSSGPGSLGRCNRAEHCGEGTHCAFLNPRSFLGWCTDGRKGTPCFVDGDCATGMRCRAVYGEDAPGRCAQGDNGDVCDADEDCQIGHCLDHHCSFGEKGNACRDATHCQSQICVYGLRCSDGSDGSECEQDTQCLSQRCARNTMLNSCTSGASGAKCLEPADCVSRHCSLPTGPGSWNEFGSCE